MNINASIIDQRISGIVENHSGWLPEGGDVNKKRSAAFVLLCMSSCLDLPLEEVADFLTEGGQDAGVDGLYIGEVEDGEFLVTLFQGKYKIKDLSGTANFPENGVKGAIHTVQTLFDPVKDVALNPVIRPKVEEIRSLVRDGYIPDVRIVLCNNGAKWKDEAQQMIDQSGLPATQTQWIHFNHDAVVDILRKTQPVDASLGFSGEAIVEDFNFRRVLVGKVAVTEIGKLFNEYGDLLLQRNIRRYLGLHTNRVNTAIHQTLQNSSSRGDFYFFNNGITIICKQFRHNALQGANYQVRLENMQIINGGQTCKTIQQTLNNPSDLFSDYADTYVMVRIYELAEDDQGFVTDITYATNSQNPVDLRDLRSNDDKQKQLELGINDLGYVYKRQRAEGGTGAQVITSSILAESVLAIWRRSPHQAKFRRREHFGKLYEVIFHGLNAAQAVLAVLIFRYVENERKRPAMADIPVFLPYASHYLAMLIGQQLLQNRQLGLNSVTHRNFAGLCDYFDDMKDDLYHQSIAQSDAALKALYGDREVSLQQLSATFRRGDLLEIL